MEIKQAIYAAVIGEQMNNKVIFTTGEAVNSGNSTFASRTIGNSRKVTGHNSIFKTKSSRNFTDSTNRRNFSSSSSNLSNSHSSSSSSSSDLNSSFSSLNLSFSSSSSVYPDTNFSTPTIKEFENNSDRLISSIKTADHIARGEIHPEGMKALMSLLDPNKKGQYTVNDASVSGEQAAQELAKRTSSEAAAETEITGYLPINLRMILGDISLAVIRGENGDPELSVRTTLSGKEADTKLEAIIVHLNTAVGSRTGSNSSSAQNIFFGSNGRRYLRLSDGFSIGLPSENVFTSGMKFTFEGSGRTQFSLSFCDFDEKNKKCWDILKESGVAEATPSDLPANGSSGLIGAWKRWNLASTLLAHFGIGSEDSDKEYEEEEEENFFDQVARQRDAILDFARGLLSNGSDSNKSSDFDKKILGRLRDLKFDDEDVEELENDVDELDVDEQAVENTEFADALEKILKEIRRESDIFRSNESLIFCLELIQNPRSFLENLQALKNDYLRYSRNESGGVSGDLLGDPWNSSNVSDYQRDGKSGSGGASSGSSQPPLSSAQRYHSDDRRDAELKELREQNEQLRKDVEEGNEELEKLGNMFELDLSNVEIPKAYEGTPDKDADRRQARLEELRKRLNLQNEDKNNSSNSEDEDS